MRPEPDFMEYSRADKTALEDAVLTCLQEGSLTATLIYERLLHEDTGFSKFTQLRYLMDAHALTLRVHKERRELSNALRRLQRREQVEYVSTGRWQLTTWWHGME